MGEPVNVTNNDTIKSISPDNLSQLFSVQKETMTKCEY